MSLIQFWFYRRSADHNLSADVSKMSGTVLDNEIMVESSNIRPRKKETSRRTFLLFLAAAITTQIDPASAQPLRRRRRRMRRRALRRLKRRGGRIHERARQAVADGEIRPLREVMAKVRRRTNAEVLDVDLHKRPRGWIYALRVMTPRGRVRDVFLDARTLEVLHLGKSTGDVGVPLPSGLSQPGQRSTNAPSKLTPPPPTPEPKSQSQPE